MVGKDDVFSIISGENLILRITAVKGNKLHRNQLFLNYLLGRSSDLVIDSQTLNYWMSARNIINE